MSTRYSLGGSLLSAGGLQVKTGLARIAQRTRLASGSLVEDIIATKRVWRFTYDELPGDTGDVLDDGLGRDALRGLFDAGGTLTLTVPLEGGSTENVTVMFGENFDESRTRVRSFWRWNVEFELDEV
jgi:hypothetical protein